MIVRAVDLDGTLAHYESGQYPEIGEPIVPMMNRVKRWVADGDTVIIFTARAAHGAEDVIRVREWLSKHGLGDLHITNQKDPDMDEFWDDKAIQVAPNTGEPIMNEGYQTGLAETLKIPSKKKKRKATDPETFELMASLEKEGKKG